METTVQIPCRCPRTADGTRPHLSDEVRLRPGLSPHDALAISKDLVVARAAQPEATDGDMLAALTEGYVMRGVEAWTLVDAEGRPLPVSRAAVRERILSDLDLALPVAELAEELYNEAVLLPLTRGSGEREESSTPTESPSSPPSPTGDSTSAPTASSRPRPTPSSPSQTSTTPTAVTGRTSSRSAGDSSSSRSSESAA